MPIQELDLVLPPQQPMICPNCSLGADWDVEMINCLPAGRYITCRQCGWIALALSWAAAGALLTMIEPAAAPSAVPGGEAMRKDDAVAIALCVKKIAFEYSERSPAGWGNRIEALVTELTDRLAAAEPIAAAGVET